MKMKLMKISVLILLLISGVALAENVCLDPLTHECDELNNQVTSCVEHAGLMPLKSPLCRCLVGYYKVETGDPGKARCQKCDDICKSVCKGPATRVLENGTEVLKHNEYCPEISPDVILAGDV